jgi:ATP-dependent helicase/DNAse subunit B
MSDTINSYSAVWVSYSSITDFLSCPRMYYLRNVYRNPKSGKKMTIMAPPLALGQAVHDVLEIISKKPVESRFDEPLLTLYESTWKNVTGKLGGFTNIDDEEKMNKRGADMIRRILKHPGPIKQKALKLKEDLPRLWLSEEDNIILCGKVDWLEYLSDTDSLHIIDFKTSRKEEEGNSLQLPIYTVLVSGVQKRKVDKISYWYLELSDELVGQTIPDLDTSKAEILSIAKEIKLARALNRFKCPRGSGCRHCEPFEAILRGEGEMVGADKYGNELFILSKKDVDVGIIH